MTSRPRAKLFAELKRRNVLRAGALYVAAAWALAQGAAQLLPVYDVSAWVMRWVIAALIIGFPFWLAFAWFYEFTPSGLKRESEIAAAESVGAHTGRKLDFWIIGILCVAVVLLLTAVFVPHKSAAPTLATIPVATGISQKSVAVLPLANESGDKNQQYFSDGLSEDLINALSQFGGLKVISRNSSFHFRNSEESSEVIGEKLGVAHLLEGSVQRLGDEVRISAELVNATDGTTLWSEHYDRPYRDLFALQDDITQAVAAALKAKLLATPGAVVQSERPPSGNLTAWNAYQQGQFYYQHSTEAESRQAITQYQAAIQADQRYARAYAALSIAWSSLAAKYSSGAEAQQLYAKARAASNTALALGPNLAAAHRARGYVLISADFDWAGAQAEFQHAVQLAPDDGDSLSNLGAMSATLGRPDQAVRLNQQALAIDPLSAGRYSGQSAILSGLGRFDDAAEAIHEAILLQPAAAGYHERLAAVEILRGDAPAALAAAQAEAPGPWQDVAMTMARQIGPDRADADAALKHLIEHWADASSYQIAEIYALRRDPDNMFKWLDRAWASRDPGIRSLLADPFILRYRRDPRFAAFCHKVGLPTATTAKAMP